MKKKRLISILLASVMLTGCLAGCGSTPSKTETESKENIELEELKKEIANVVSTLKEREQTVIKMRFGLENFTKTTLEDIGKLFGVTKECIRQTEMRALNKLKRGAELYGW